MTENITMTREQLATLLPTIKYGEPTLFSKLSELELEALWKMLSDPIPWISPLPFRADHIAILFEVATEMNLRGNDIWAGEE